MAADIRFSAHSSGAHSGQRHVTFYMDTTIYRRLDELAHIENMPRERLLEKMISSYVPTSAVLNEGEFRAIYMNEIRNLQRLHPYAAVVSVFRNSKIGCDEESRKQWRDGYLTWNELKRLYIERLNMPDATEEIARLRELKKTQDIYITSVERVEEFSIRKLFVDFVNGKLIWK